MELKTKTSEMTREQLLKKNEINKGVKAWGDFSTDTESPVCSSFIIRLSDSYNIRSTFSCF